MKKTGSILLALLIAGTTLKAQRQMEWLDRGLIAVPDRQGKVLVSWRLLGTEDPQSVFNVFRSSGGKTIKLNTTPVELATSFLDSTANTAIENLYTVTLVTKKKEEKDGASYKLPANPKPYLSIPLNTPTGYSANDASVGDMDGDGVYELVIHMTGRGKDNSQKGITDPPIFHCYKLDGTFLWEINLGKNIREGAHYTQFMVYDLDGDGKAEVAMKTADGTIDGKGNVIGDSTKDFRNEGGYILSGPEYLTVFNGLTGAEKSTVMYDPPRYPDNLFPTTDQLKSLWGDGYGNRMDRFLACIAYLDGVHPSLVMCRGYYTRTVLAAWDLKNGKLQKNIVYPVLYRTATVPDIARLRLGSKSNGKISLAELKMVNKLSLDDKDFKTKITYNILCEVSCKPSKSSDMYVFNIRNGDLQGNPDFQELLSKVSKGDKIRFDKIKVIGNNKTARPLESVTFLIE